MAVSARPHHRLNLLSFPMTNSESTGSTEASAETAGYVVPALFVACIALLVMPTPEGMRPEAQRLIAVTVLMAGLWVTQAIPLAATSLLPLVLFPFLGIESAREVSASYINDNVFLYLGGFIIALGIERWNLHRRIALNIVNVVGVSPKRLVLGFLVATGGLSMWISNTASTLLMLPIALALLKTLDDQDTTSVDDGPPISKALAVPLLLAIAYSASIGGLTTIVGTPTNAQAVAIYHQELPDAPRITVAAWMIASVPMGVLYLGFVWFVLTRGLPDTSRHDAAIRTDLRKRLKALGSANVAEIRMLSVFLLTAVLWVFRNPLSIGPVSVPGWSNLMPDWFQLMKITSAADAEFPPDPTKFVNDSTISMLMAVALFFIPSGTRSVHGKQIRLMNWSTASRLPWDIVLLFGGGFALAGAFGTTELSSWMGTALEGPLQGQPLWLIIAVVCLLMTFLTEFTSNVATVSTLMPTLCVMCVTLKIDPRMLIIPATLATSCAFTLPIATPPNAIVFGSGLINVRQMARYGLVLNLAGIPILTAGTYLLIKPIFGID